MTSIGRLIGCASHIVDNWGTVSAPFYADRPAAPVTLLPPFHPHIGLVSPFSCKCAQKAGGISVTAIAERETAIAERERGVHAMRVTHVD